MIRPPRPLSSFELQAKRLPTRKRMTIAVGVLAQDGVVLATDTEKMAAV